jgi:hypothetical protein
MCIGAESQVYKGYNDSLKTHVYIDFNDKIHSWLCITFDKTSLGGKIESVDIDDKIPGEYYYHYTCDSAQIDSVMINYRIGQGTFYFSGNKLLVIGIRSLESTEYPAYKAIYARRKRD